MIDKKAIQERLKKFDLAGLFTQELGWDWHTHALSVTFQEKTFNLSALAHKRGMVAYHCPCPAGGIFPDYPTRLRGTSPVVICSARSLDKFRIPPDWKKPLADGRLLLLSCFPNGPHRPTVETAQQRNEFVAALATDILVIHATPGGHLEQLIASLKSRNIPVNYV